MSVYEVANMPLVAFVTPSREEELVASMRKVGRKNAMFLISGYAHCVRVSLLAKAFSNE